MLDPSERTVPSAAVRRRDAESSALTSAWTRVAALILSLSLAVACDYLGPTSSSERKPPSFSPETRAVVEGSNRFGLRLFRGLNLVNRTEDPRIQLISPTGITASLTMLLEGARGTTREKIRNAINLPEQARSHALDAHSRVLAHLSEYGSDFFYESKEVLFIRKGLRLTESYPLVSRRLVGAELHQVDFAHPKALPILNEWIDNLTRGRAPRLMNQLSVQDLMTAMNPAYVVGSWRYWFDPARTAPDTFRTYDDAILELPFMRQDGIYPYARTDSTRLVSLPYGDSLFSMRILLPGEETSVHTLVQRLDLESWRTLTADLEPRYLDLALPKLELSYRETLNNELSGLGLTEIFSPASAEFEGIGPGTLALSRFRHKSNLGRLSETGVRPPRRPRGSAEPLSFHVERPFVLVVSERITGALVFVGMVAGPPSPPPPPERGPLPPLDELR